MESKREDAKLAYVEKGLEVAATEAARAKLVCTASCFIAHHDLMMNFLEFTAIPEPLSNAYGFNTCNTCNSLKCVPGTAGMR